MIYCRIRSHLIDLMGKKPAKDDDRLQNALSVRSGLKLFFFFKPYVFEGCYFYYVLIIVRGSAFWLERLCNICAFNVMQNTTCMRGEQKVPPPLGRVRRGIFTQYSPLAKNNNFAHDCHANAWWDPLFRSLVLCSSSNDPSAQGKMSGSELLNRTFRWQLVQKKCFRTCERGVFFFFSFYASSASSCLRDSSLSLPFLNLTLLNMPDLVCRRAPES